MQCFAFYRWKSLSKKSTRTNHVVDGCIRCVVRDCLKWRPGSTAVSGCCHLPAKMNGGLVDAGLLAVLSHYWVLRIMGVTRGHTDQRVTWRWRLLTVLLRHLLDIVVVGERHYLHENENEILWTLYVCSNVLTNRYREVCNIIVNRGYCKLGTGNNSIGRETKRKNSLKIWKLKLI